MKNLRRIAVLGLFLALFLPAMSFAGRGYSRPIKVSACYIYSPCYSCQGYYIGRWYLGYLIGWDSCDIQIENHMVVRVFRYLPL